MKGILKFCTSSIGRKFVVAITGMILVGFILGHMAGNQLVFVGREAMNDYAEFLHHSLHGAGIWVARSVLLVSFVLHIVATISLVIENRNSRKTRYANHSTMTASWSSRLMILSGLIILTFVIVHILHHTVRINPELAELTDPHKPDRHDTYGMVILSFQNPLVCLFYCLSTSVLCSHLSHGLSSIFQTLGLRTRKTQNTIDLACRVVTIIIWAGFIISPICIYLKFITDKGS